MYNIFFSNINHKKKISEVTLKPCYHSVFEISSLKGTWPFNLNKLRSHLKKKVLNWHLHWIKLWVVHHLWLIELNIGLQKFKLWYFHYSSFSKSFTLIKIVFLREQKGVSDTKLIRLPSRQRSSVQSAHRSFFQSEIQALMWSVLQLSRSSSNSQLSRFL